MDRMDLKSDLSQVILFSLYVVLDMFSNLSLNSAIVKDLTSPRVVSFVKTGRLSAASSIGRVLVALK